MTTRTTYILWHILLPVFLFLLLVYSLVSAASEWREHGKWECDNYHQHIFNVERYVGWCCILNCFMLSSLHCFYAFCWSAISTSRYTFLTFFFILVLSGGLQHSWVFNHMQTIHKWLWFSIHRWLPNICSASD